MPPHRHRRGGEGAGAVARDQERTHVARQHHRRDQDAGDERHRPGIADEREAGRAGACQPLGHRSGTQEEEPGGAEDQPDPAELGRQLAHVGEGDAEREHGQRRRGDDGERERRPAEATRRAPRRFTDDRERPGERARERAAREHHHRQDQHRQPEMALVIESEVAIAGMAVERQVEQHQPADAGREHEPGVADARAHRLPRRRHVPGIARRCDDRQDDAGRGEDDDERRRRAGPGELGARRSEAVRSGERPRHPRQPSGHRPDDERDAGAEPGPAAVAAPEHEPEADRHRRRPLRSGAGQQLAHRVVLALVDVYLARVGHQRGAAGERFDRPRAAGDGGRGRQARLSGERAGGAPAVERRREQHDGVGARRRCRRHRHPTPSPAPAGRVASAAAVHSLAQRSGVGPPALPAASRKRST